MMFCGCRLFRATQIAAGKGKAPESVAGAFSEIGQAVRRHAQDGAAKVFAAVPR